MKQRTTHRRTTLDVQARIAGRVVAYQHLRIGVFDAITAIIGSFAHTVFFHAFLRAAFSNRREFLAFVNRNRGPVASIRALRFLLFLLLGLDDFWRLWAIHTISSVRSDRM